MTPGIAPAAGGTASTAVLLADLFAFAVATALSLYLAVRLYRGYRATRDPEMGALGVGLLLLTTAPLLVRLVLSNVTGVDATTRAIVAAASQLLGLLVVLGVIYGER